MCMYVLFPIFDIFDIHCITALICIWRIFDIFNIDSITFIANENDISDTFDMSHALYKNVCVCSFPSSTSSAYIALQPLGVFDLSSTSST